jgi:methyl-accepting chemotaxis protein
MLASSIAAQVNRLLFSLIALMLLIGGLSGYSGYKANSELASIEVSSQRATGDVVELVKLIGELRFHTVQVQQWLTDVSATRGLDGLNDGFDVAAKHAASYQAKSKKARAIAERLGQAEIAAEIDKLSIKFEPYYAQGQMMAKAYVADGPAAGNKLMSSFDAAASAVSEALNPLLAHTEVYAAQEQSAIAKTINKQQQAQKFLSFGLLASLLITLGICVYASVRINRAVVRPL